MLMGTLGASLLGDILSKGLLGGEKIRAGEGIKKKITNVPKFFYKFCNTRLFQK